MKTRTFAPPGPAGVEPLLSWRRILVPVDFSPRSQLAVRYAGGLARKVGAAVELLFVVEPAPFYSGLEYTPLTIDNVRLADIAEGRLRKLAATLLPVGAQAGVAVRQGRAPTEILAHARARDVDLIIVPTHGYSGLERLLMGSTAERLVRHAPCPVLTLRLEARAGGVRRGGTDAPRLRRLLAPVDFSAPSGEALRVAAELADRFRSALTVLHVVFSAPVPDRLAATARRLEPRAIELAQKEMTAWLRTRLPTHPAATTEIVAGLPHKEIVRAAGRLETDLLVIATQGRTGLKRLIMGSTTEQVIRHAPCPVLVLRPRGSPPRPAGAGVPPGERARAAGRTGAATGARSLRTLRSTLPRHNPAGWPRMKDGEFA